jgi:hypothetical protein
VTAAATLWNAVIQDRPHLQALPLLRSAETGERFGVLIGSASAQTLIKTEEIDFPGFEATIPLEEVVWENFTVGENTPESQSHLEVEQALAATRKSTGRYCLVFAALITSSYLGSKSLLLHNLYLASRLSLPLQSRHLQNAGLKLFQMRHDRFRSSVPDAKGIATNLK